MRLRTPVIAVLVTGVFLLGIAGSILFNLWKTTGAKEASAITSPSAIKGSMPFSLVSQGMGIPLQDLFIAFDIKGKMDILCKEVESLYGFVNGGEIGTDSVRLFAALYTGQPHTPASSTRLPQQAFDVLKKKLGAEKLEPIKSLFISVSGKIN